MYICIIVPSCDYYSFHLPVAAGLPANQLAIDENTVYWSQSSQSTVHYTNRTGPQNLQTFTTSSNEFVILGVSPGQQPFPDTGKGDILTLHMIHPTPLINYKL